MLGSRTTGEVIDPTWTQFSFPPRLLRRPARARLENPHEGQLDFDMDAGEGKPSRWNTLRAMRVLLWYESAGT